MLPAALCRRYALAPVFFFFNDTATTEIYTLSLHDALPISLERLAQHDEQQANGDAVEHPRGDHGCFSRSRSASSLRSRRSSSSLRFLSETSWVRSSSGDPSNTLSTSRRSAVRPATSLLTSGL